MSVKPNASVMPCTLSNSALTATSPASAADTSGSAPNKVKPAWRYAKPHQQDHAESGGAAQPGGFGLRALLDDRREVSRAADRERGRRRAAHALELGAQRVQGESLAIGVEGRGARLREQQCALTVRGEPHIVDAPRLEARLPARGEMQHLERGIARQPFFEHHGCRRRHVGGSIRELGRQSPLVERPRVEGVGEQVTVREQILRNIQGVLFAIGDQAECGVGAQGRGEFLREPGQHCGFVTADRHQQQSRRRAFADVLHQQLLLLGAWRRHEQAQVGGDDQPRVNKGEAHRQQATPAASSSAARRFMAARPAGPARGRGVRVRREMRSAGTGAATRESASRVSAPSPSGSSAATQPGRSPLPNTSIRSRCFASRGSRGLSVSVQWVACSSSVTSKSWPSGARRPSSSARKLPSNTRNCGARASEMVRAGRPSRAMRTVSPATSVDSR